MGDFGNVRRRKSHDELAKDRGMRYTVCELPPLLLTMLLGFQHYLTMLGAMVLIPQLTVVAMGGDRLDTANVISTIFLVSGLNTLIQTSIGSRLPITQGISFAFIGPTFNIILNEELQAIEDPKERFETTMQSIQGAIIICGCMQILLGYTGLMTFALRLISPLSILPTVCTISLSLYPIGLHGVSKCWEVGLPQIAMVIIFSQFCDRITIPVKDLGPLRICKISPVMLAIAVVWMWAFLLTKSLVWESFSPCRTDLSTVIFDAKWFHCPYPFQWGWPRFKLYAISAMSSATLASLVQSVGDYYACARECGAPVPTRAIISRGLGVEGFSLLFCGIWGTGSGTSSYAESITAITITKVGSRAVIQMGALIMLLCSPIGKLGAVFASMPEPMVSALFCSIFGLTSSAALSNLRYVDMGSSRNFFIFMSALFSGMMLSGPGGYFATYGNRTVYMPVSNISAPMLGCIEQISANISNVTVPSFSINMSPLSNNPFGDGDWASAGQAFFFNNPMIVALLCAIVLDNMTPGTREERGLEAWDESKEKNVHNDEEYARVYLLPLKLGRCVRDFIYLDWIDSCRRPQQPITNMSSRGDLHELLFPCCPCSKHNATNPEIVEYRV